MPSTVLDPELSTFKQALPVLLVEHPGKFALVCGEAVHSCWDTWDDALQAGFQTFGVQPFLVKQVLKSEPAIYCFGIAAP